MHDQRTSDDRDDRIDGLILAMLLDDDAQRPWSDDEIGREAGDRIATADSLARLTASGLIHRLDGFVFATRAALHVRRLSL